MILYYLFQSFNIIYIKLVNVNYYQFNDIKILYLLILILIYFLLSNLFNDFVNNIPNENISLINILLKQFLYY